MTVGQFYREVAKLGGFLARKGDGEPGWITVWPGWEKLNLDVNLARERDNKKILGNDKAGSLSHTFPYVARVLFSPDEDALMVAVVQRDDFGDVEKPAPGPPQITIAVKYDSTIGPQIRMPEIKPRIGQFGLQ